MQAIAAINLMRRMARPQIRRKTYKERQNPFTLPENVFKKRYRFNKASVLYVVDLISNDLKKDRRGGGVSPRLQVLVALRCWGRREVQDDSGDLHGLSQATVCRICLRVARALAKLARVFIKMPESLAEQERVMQRFQAIANFPRVIGAIDCTHIRIKKTGGDLAQYYINRKGYYSLNVQVVCDSTLRIMDIVARWRGSTHDSRIWNESTLKTKFEDGNFRGVLLGDSGYPLLPFLYTPLLRAGTEAEERYNRAHIRTRNVVERCFGVWKQRFLCLLYGLPYKYQNCKVVIVALAVLHNIAIEMNDDHLLENNYLLEDGQEENHPIERGQGNARRRVNQMVLNNFILNNF